MNSVAWMRRLRSRRKKAGLGDRYRVTEYPRKKELLEAIQEFLEHHAPGAARTSTGVLGRLTSRLEGEWKVLRSFNDPQGVYARLPLTISIR